MIHLLTTYLLSQCHVHPLFTGPVKAGTFLFFRQGVIHHGMQNDLKHDRRVVFDMFQNEFAKKNKSSIDHQVFEWMLIGQAYGEESPEFSAALIRHEKYKPMKRYTIKHAIDLNQYVKYNSEALSDFAHRTTKELKPYVYRAQAKNQVQLAKAEIEAIEQAKRDKENLQQMIDGLSGNKSMTPAAVASMRKTLTLSLELANKTISSGESNAAAMAAKVKQSEEASKSADSHVTTLVDSSEPLHATASNRRNGLVETIVESSDEEEEEEKKDETFTPNLRKRTSPIAKKRSPPKRQQK